MPPIDFQICKTENRWHSVDADINHIETALVNSIIVYNESYTHFWEPIARLYVSSFASRSYVVSQIVIDCYPLFFSKWRRGPITFSLLLLAIFSM